MITVGTKVVVTKGCRGFDISKGAICKVTEVNPLGAEYSHKVRVVIYFYGSGRTRTFYAHHQNRLADPIVRFNNGGDPTKYFEVKERT